jgi:hypothetical protein
MLVTVLPFRAMLAFIMARIFVVTSFIHVVMKIKALEKYASIEMNLGATIEEPTVIVIIDLYLWWFNNDSFLRFLL